MAKNPATVYLIGGAPRVGKSTLAHLLTQQQSLQLASTDAIRTQLRRTTPQSTEPDLYYLDSLNANEANMARLMREHTGDIIAAANRESAIVWRTTESFIQTNLKTRRSLVIEGVAILPHQVATLPGNIQAVFLGNQSSDHARVIAEYAHGHPDSWLGGLKPQTIEAFAHFVRATSANIEQEAHAYNQIYIEMSAQPFEESLHLALGSLLQNGQRPR